MIGAFAYLIGRSTRNKWVSQIKRVRNPRYAIAVILGIGYFVMLTFNMSRNSPPPSTVSSVAASSLAALLPVLLLLMAAYAWIFGTDASALAFSPAEVSLLFSAPVSRRGLILYKIVRAQTAVLTTSLVWYVLFRRTGGIERAFSYWVALSIINTHRLGIALIRSSSAEHGVASARRNWPAVLVFVVAFSTVAAGLANAWPAVMAAPDASAILATLVRVTSTTPVSWVLYPFHLSVAPAFTPRGFAWLLAMLSAVAVLALHVIWVLWTDANFEEAAAEASAKQAARVAAMRSRGASTLTLSVRGRKRTVRLRASGPPWVAIVWKNYLFLQRAGMLRTMIGLPALLAVIALAFARRSELAEVMVLATSLALAAMIAIFGPMSMRSDLRGELARVPLLKTMPLSGRAIVFAEIVGTAAPTAVMQYLLLISATIAVSVMQGKAPSMAIRLGVLLGAPVLLLGLNLANFTIHNGIALLFPAWVRTGEVGAAGVETIGQGMLTIIITVFLLSILLLVPVAVGAGMYFYWRSLPIVALSFTGFVAGVILGAESLGLMHLLGRSLERLEPAQVG